MEEKYMVNDVLTGVKGQLKTYQGAISECANMRFKTNSSTNKKQ